MIVKNLLVIEAPCSASGDFSSILIIYFQWKEQHVLLGVKDNEILCLKIYLWSEKSKQTSLNVFLIRLEELIMTRPY